MATFNFPKEFSKTFESSCGTTPQWASFYRKSVNWLRKELSPFAEKLEVSRGHFYFSGFFTSKKTGQIFYFSISDVRYFKEPKMLIRTAVSYKDYTGGTNEYVPIDENLAEHIEYLINTPKFLVIN